MHIFFPNNSTQVLLFLKKPARTGCSESPYTLIWKDESTGEMNLIDSLGVSTSDDGYYSISLDFGFSDKNDGNFIKIYVFSNVCPPADPISLDNYKFYMADYVAYYGKAFCTSSIDRHSVYTQNGLYNSLNQTYSSYISQASDNDFEIL